MRLQLILKYSRLEFSQVFENQSEDLSHRRHNLERLIHNLQITKEKLADEPVSRILCAASRSLTYVSGRLALPAIRRD
jgi:hypothetical protein